eukprot:10422781-Prorocentrum_lima.AAC.1
MTTTVNFLCEKHGKGRVDGLCALASHSKRMEAKKQMLVTLDDLVAAYKRQHTQSQQAITLEVE